MVKNFFLFLSAIFILSCNTQAPITKTKPVSKTDEENSENNIYRSAYTMHADLVHTQLRISLNWNERELSGSALITLHPHFYPTDSLVLNARGMKIEVVELVNDSGTYIPLKFEYDSILLHIHLDRTYSKNENIKLNVEYLSMPEKLKTGGSSAIQSDKGLYFIDADSSDGDTPTQVWTQGETESNSAWFPTIEDPQQKMTQEIYITVDSAFTTVSNGLLISTIYNPDGTKTDYWKQSLPAAPYLTVIAVGKFAVVKDSWKNIEVNYYVDPPYEKYARMTFGNTPEMISFFSNLLKVPYVWEKYSQIVVHDYVSGAMENTTAVIHGTNMQQDSRDFKDSNYEDYISHELFHHWFGDLVTCESWSNITLNEGFANYAEYLWREYKYGRDNADHLNQADQSTYLYSSTQTDPPLIRFYYEEREEVYDAVSYNKGGRALHMLRKYVGDSAFFQSLNLYLNQHRFGAAEVTDLRLAFEKITGEDLNWFFNQWFLEAGHPKISIEYSWDETAKNETVTLHQTQNLEKNVLYKIPLDVDIYLDDRIERKKIILTEAIQKFQFALPSKPNLVNVDAEKMLLCEKDDRKTNGEYIYQYNHAPLYLDRFEAISKLGVNYRVKTPEANTILKALKDPYYAIRLSALNNIGELALNHPDTVKEELIKMAKSDSSADVRERALTNIGKYFSFNEFKNLFEEALKDSSYKVEARAFKIISEKDFARANELAGSLEKDSGRAILTRLSEFYNNSKEDKTAFYKRALRLSSTYNRYTILRDFTKYLQNQENAAIVEKGIEIIFERAAYPISRHYKNIYINSLKELETSINKKITALENGNPISKDANETIDRQKSLKELTALKNKLHERIGAIDK